MGDFQIPDEVRQTAEAFNQEAKNIEATTLSKENKEQEQKPITFHVTNYRGGESILQVCSDEEFNDLKAKGETERGVINGIHYNIDDNPQADTEWTSVTVANEEDKKKWIELYNQKLSLWFRLEHSKNIFADTSDDRKLLSEIYDKLSELENKVPETAADRKRRGPFIEKAAYKDEIKKAA